MWYALDLWCWRALRTTIELAGLFVLGTCSLLSGLGLGLLSGFGFLSGLLIGAGAALTIAAVLLDCGFKTACGIEDM